MCFVKLPSVRVLSLLLFLAMAVLVATSPLAAQSEEDEDTPLVARTVPTWMNVRSGPGVLNPVAGVVPAGTELAILGENESGTWLRVEIEGFDEPVWVAKGLVLFDLPGAEITPLNDADLDSPDDPASPDAATDAAAVDPCVADDGTHQGAEATDPAIDPSSAGVNAAEADGGTTDTTEPTNTTSATTEDEPEETEATEPEDDPIALLAADGPVAITQPARMNVRQGPGTEYGVATVLEQGSVARIIGIGPRDEWYQVELDSQEEPAWLYQALTELLGSLADTPQLSEDEIPPRPAPPPVAEAAPAAPAVAAARLPGVGFGYGLQAHMIHTGQEGLALDKTRELGFNWMKQQIEWKIFESQPGQYGFGDIHPIVNAANVRGVNLLFSVVNAPDWAREANFDGSVGGPPADPQVFANFLGRLAGEFCGSSLKAIEVWNEQNLHYEWGNRPINPAEYMALLRPSYAAIKNACPSMYVVSGALTPAGDNGSIAMDDFRYFEAMLQQGLANYADGFGAHPSGYNVPPSVGWQSACGVIQQTGNRFNGACDSPHHSWSFRSTMEGYRNLAVRYGAAHVPIWPTEFGWAAGGSFHPAYVYADDNDYDEQARWTVEAFQMMRNWGWVGPAFLWNLNFRVVANGTEKAQWGIVDNQWRPLPVFHALQGMAK